MIDEKKLLGGIKVMKLGADIIPNKYYYNGYMSALSAVEGMIAGQSEGINKAGRIAVIPESGIGDLSDGYHTSNELYHHRAILFSAICNTHPESAWKAKKHSDGTMYDGMFIVGINTPTGQATYHYDINPYWDKFRVIELESAPEWDGHTPDEAIARIETMALTEAARKERNNDNR
ncbi:MAG: hypothetical protein ACI4LN_03855 [Anaerovoracaceae bacterium]